MLYKCILVLVVALFLSEVQAESIPQHNHRYKEKSPLIVFVNKIGPFSNPSETYDYYVLPFCFPSDRKVQHRHKTLGEALEGDHLSNSLYDIRFNVPVTWQQLCEVHLKQKEIAAFKKAIHEFYYFEFYVDDLPVRGFIGTEDVEAGSLNKEPRSFLFKHLHFTVLYNNDRVIHANVTADLRQVQLLGNEDIVMEFSYSVSWHKTDIEWGDRMTLFHDNFFDTELDIHWLSIMNSLVLVLLLTGFIVLIIRRVLHSDYDRYMRASNEADDNDDYGWKLVHGDVFRLPDNVMLLAAFAGCGVQASVLCLSMLSLAIAGFFPYSKTDFVYSAGLVINSITSLIAGWVSASLFKKLKGDGWHWNLILTGTVFAGPLLVTGAVVNGISTAWGITSALSASTVVIFLLMWLLVNMPLTIMGGVAGRRISSEFTPPVRVSNFPRHIPEVAWYRSAPLQFLCAGFLPFSAIYIELYYVYTSVWGRNSYTLYGILMLVFIILLVVTSCISVALTYFQLSQEDHHWWWRSFINGGASGVFIYAYSIFYYFYRSQMTGFLQSSVYFGYMLVISYYFFLMLGTIGFFSSYLFVQTIYRGLKVA